MKEEAVRRELAALLEASGAEWTEALGVLRFRLRRDGLCWETDCRPLPGQALFYGRYPFRVKNREAAALVCSCINARVLRGGMFLSREGSMVFRTRAELEEPWGARGRLAAALEYNAEVIVHFWAQAAGERFQEG